MALAKCLFDSQDEPIELSFKHLALEMSHIMV